MTSATDELKPQQRQARAGTTGAISTTMTPLVMAALATLSLIWGASFFLGAVALQSISPFILVWLRVSLAAATLWTLALVFRLPLPPGWRAWRALIFMGLINNVVPFGLIFWGQLKVASSLASIFNATTPLFTVLVAGLLLPDERFSRLKLMGLLLGLAGVVALVGPQALQGLGHDLVSQLAILGAACSYAFAVVFARRFAAMGIRPFTLALGQLSGSCLIMTLLVALVEPPWLLDWPSLLANHQLWLAITVLAVVATAFAYLLYFCVLGKAGATNASLVTFLVPGWAIVLGLVVLGERLTAWHMLGFALILCGLVALDGRLFRLLSDP